LQTAETEEVASLGEEDLMVLFLALCFDDLLGGSGKRVSVDFEFLGEV
jgi:hypothetical protein